MTDKLPTIYPDFKEDLKSRIRTARIRAALSLNRELIGKKYRISNSLLEIWTAEIPYGLSDVDYYCEAITCFPLKGMNQAVRGKSLCTFA